MIGMLSLLLLGIAHGDSEPVPFCVIAWSGSARLPSDVRLLISRRQLELLAHEESKYTAALLSDWKQMVRVAPARLIALTQDLSVGPVRTMRISIVTPESSAGIIKQWLGRV